jgi:nitrogen regulatory protein P-II 1
LEIKQIKTLNKVNLMKKIEAVIKPFKIDEVKEALEKVGVRGITMTEAKGLGRQRGFTEVNTGVEYGDFLPKIKLEIILQDDLVDTAVEAIRASANTNRIGDGKIFVSTIDTVLRIRTGETGSDAL